MVALELLEPDDELRSAANAKGRIDAIESLLDGPHGQLEPRSDLFVREALVAYVHVAGTTSWTLANRQDESNNPIVIAPFDLPNTPGGGSTNVLSSLQVVRVVSSTEAWGYACGLDASGIGFDWTFWPSNRATFAANTAQRPARHRLVNPAARTETGRLAWMQDVASGAWPGARPHWVPSSPQRQWQRARWRAARWRLGWAV